MKTKKYGFLIDMDGVIYRGSELIKGSKEFIDHLLEKNIPFLFLTNNSRLTRGEVVLKMKRFGILIDERHVYTSAMATARYLAMQKQRGTAFVIGEGGLLNALYDHGYAIDEIHPDYVIVGEGRTLNLEMVEKAINMILDGAKLIATNLDPSPKIREWMKPGTAAIIAMLEEATGKKAFSCGKPSPIMMRAARKEIELQTDETIMLGDTMETDILGATWMGYRNILTLGGATKKEDIGNYPFQPNYVIDSVAEIFNLDIF